jgi:hypothetical protein
MVTALCHTSSKSSKIMRFREDGQVVRMAKEKFAEKSSGSAQFTVAKFIPLITISAQHSFVRASEQLT